VTPVATALPAAEPIAIVGIGCRFPGGIGSPAQLWAALVESRDAIGPVPAERRMAWAAPPFGGFLDDVFGFDAAFFGLAPGEAEAIDPQQRLLLMTAREALDDAGVRAAALAGSRTGVFVGLFGADYAARRPTAGMLDYLGTSRGGAAGRIAFDLDLRGPAAVIDTDRSSGLVALLDACASLRAGDCDAAIVGAASVILDPRISAAFHGAGMLAADGRCKFGDERADGFVRSEGVAALVLMPLARALAGHHRVYAVVRGGAVTSNGRSAGDLMAPSSDAQAALLRLACARAAVAPADLVYVEAHGTGTPRGDRSELEALADVVGERDGRPCWVGSIKTNLGHCEPCAGLAGVIKVALAAHHRALPPSLHFRRFPTGLAGAGRLRVPTEVVTLDDHPFVAGVSSFGLTGINAHAVLAGAPVATMPAAPPPDGVAVIALSAQTDHSLRALADRHADQLASGAPLWDVARAAAARDGRPRRAAVVARTADDAVAQLRALAAGGPTVTAAWRPGDRLVFVFPGQGSQWIGMGAGLLRESRPFARAMAACDEVVRGLADWSLLAELEKGTAFDRIDVVQPLLVAIEIALAAMWRAWGIEPDAVVGTSMGEIAAAHVAGALSLTDALRVVVERTRLMRSLRGGAMAVVELPAAQIQPRLDPRRVAIAAINSASSTVVSGDADEVARLVSDVEAAGGFARLVRVDVASHSPRMDPILGPLEARLAGLAPRSAVVPMWSTVTGRPIDGAELDARYWARNLREPVDLAGAVAAASAAGATVFLELSPHPVLRSPLLDGVAAAGGERLVAYSLERDSDELRAARAALAQLHGFGVPVAWDRVLGAGPAAPLPVYPWTTVPLGAPADTLAATAMPARAPGASDAPAETFAQRLLALAPTARLRALHEALAAELARVLRVPASSIDLDRPLRDQGLTSAASTELRVTLGRWLGAALPASVVFDHPTVRRLAAHLGEHLAPPVREAVAAPLSLPGGEPLAIVGMALRFPGGATTPEAYWDLLAAGGDAITEVPPDRWDAARYYERDGRSAGTMRTRWGGFVDGIAGFDADFFGISPKEAESMDPQQRLLLELAWEALDDAGSSRARISGTATGVFVGVMNNNEYAARRGGLADIVAHTSTGEATSVAAGRVSFVFGLHGPAIAVDTACSSSLVALHLAAQSIRSGECEAALVAGVNVIAHPATTIAFSKTRMLSPTGRCRTFDAAADGYVRGEGACVLVVKALARALADGDRIHAVVRGTAVNHDGRASGLTAPNGAAQEALLRRALADAGVAAAEVSYLEAHGTGTPLGDPIEVDAIGRAFAGRGADNPLVVGAVKANIGHLEACAGLAGVAKVVLAMRAATIPRQVHLATINPKLTVPAWLTLPRENLPWAPPGRRIAGVSSFGFSGTNAHVVLEEPPAEVPIAAAPTGAVVVPVSAATRDGLAALARRYAAAFAEPGADLASLAASAGRREPLPVRAAIVATSRDDARRQLAALGDDAGAAAVPAEPVVGFVYGDGVDVDVDAALALHAAAPAFRAAVTACLGPNIGYDAAFLRDRRAATVATQIGLTALLAELGVRPEHVAGAGAGELVAGHVAGLLDLDTAWSLALGRPATVVTGRPRLTFAPGRAGDPADPAYWRAAPVDSAPALAACTVVVALDALAPLGAEPLAATLARLFVAGVDVDWRRVHASRGRHHPLPAYPFTRRTYWRTHHEH
jgi:acyl transferase domain-containing protein